MDITHPQMVRNLAARLWFRAMGLESIAEYLEISVDEISDILSSEAYRVEVETLLRTTRSPGNLLKWIDREGDDVIALRLAARMHLPDTVVSEMIANAKRDIRQGKELF